MKTLEIIFLSFLALLLFGFIVLEIYAIINYGGKPIAEIPSWLLWLWFVG